MKEEGSLRFDVRVATAFVLLFAHATGVCGFAQQANSPDDPTHTAGASRDRLSSNQAADKIRGLDGEIEPRGKDAFRVTLRGDVIGYASLMGRPVKAVRSGTPKWKGTDADFALLLDLGNVEILELDGLAASDEALVEADPQVLDPPSPPYL
ncbi:MAG TPA: hypothetical protein VGX78_22380 [Pirellulales bacterium]|jgi:hypothetical protein|nr:hypothetical protein [Pirellulales bacterium]